MNRRELFRKTAGGITGVVASHLALSSCANEKPEQEVEFIADKEKGLAKTLREKGIYVTGRRWKEGHIRVSPHFYNNEEDIDVFVRTLSDVAG